MTDATGETGTSGTESTRQALVRVRSETQRLLTRLEDAFDEVVAASAGSNADDEHDPEGATIAYERSQLDALLRQSATQLAEVDAALARLAEGRYGICETCGRSIAAERLEARPVARTCMRCATTGTPR